MGKEVQRGIHAVLGVICVILVLAGVAWLVAYKALNPSDENHILIVNQSGKTISGPVYIEFVGDRGVRWSREMSPVFHLDDLPNSCAVVNLDRAFFSGELRIRDGTGEVRFAGAMRPPGRYCGTVVVVIVPSNKRKEIQECSFNQIKLPRTKVSNREP